MARADRLGSPPPTSRRAPRMRPSASGGLSATTRVWKVKSGPSRVSARAVVNSLVFEGGHKRGTGFGLENRLPAPETQIGNPQNPPRAGFGGYQIGGSGQRKDA